MPAASVLEPLSLPVLLYRISLCFKSLEVCAWALSSVSSPRHQQELGITRRSVLHVPGRVLQQGCCWSSSSQHCPRVDGSRLGCRGGSLGWPGHPVFTAPWWLTTFQKLIVSKAFHAFVKIVWNKPEFVIVIKDLCRTISLPIYWPLNTNQQIQTDI